jgi:uncharacterized protein YutE (UPF0331/DUF86 family)
MDMEIRMNEPIENVRISPRGRSVTIIYKNGKKWVESYDDCLRVFHDTERAKNEYFMRLWYILHTYTDLSDEKVDEILKTVKERLIKENFRSFT